MSKKAKTIISLLLFLTAMLQLIPSVVADIPQSLIQSSQGNGAEGQTVNITFNDIETNQVNIDGITVKGGKAVVAVTNPKNKGLYLKKYTSETSVLVQGIAVDYNDEVVYSLDVMSCGQPVNLTLGTAVTDVAASRADIRFFEIKNNAILTHNGKKIGTVGKTGYTQIAVVVKKQLVCDYYINGRAVLLNWDLPSFVSLGTLIAIRQSPESACYIDNLRCYKASTIDKKMIESTFSPERTDLVGQQDFKGDVTFFDSRFCNTTTQKYGNRVEFVPKSNTIITTRFNNPKSPDRTNYIYMKRKDDSADCFFQVYMAMPDIAHASDFKYRYLKMEGDFKADILQEIYFQVRDSETTGRSLDNNVIIHPDGSLKSGGVTVGNVVKQGEWFHLVWILNIDTLKYDVYVDDRKIVSNSNLNAEMTQFNMLRVNLNYSSVVGDLYVDNFSVTGLVKPVVDGVETKTSVIANDEDVIEFMKDKTGMHVYGNTLYKDAIKSTLATKGIYEDETEQYYVTADTLSKAFDLALIDKDGEIIGDGISVKKDGTVTLADGASFKLEFPPKFQEGKMYVPIKQFAADAVGKHVWWFKTGILLFADYEMKIDTEGWQYQNARRTEQCTVWNDIDYLNAYLQYVRPDITKLKADYIAATADATFSQHPRLIHTATDFEKMKEKFKSGENSSLASYIKEADSYGLKNLVTYNFENEEEITKGEDLSKRFKAWGYAYNLTGERKYAEMAFAQFEKIASFPDLEMGTDAQSYRALHAIALGYDWLYNGFTAEEKEIARNVLRKYLELYAGAFYGRLTSVSNEVTEWSVVKSLSANNVIYNTAITLAALAAAEPDYEIAFDYIANSIRSVEYGMQMFPPEGKLSEKEPNQELLKKSLASLCSNMKKNFGSLYNVFVGNGMDELFELNNSDDGFVENVID